MNNQIQMSKVLNQRNKKTLVKYSFEEGFYKTVNQWIVETCFHAISMLLWFIIIFCLPSMQNCIIICLIKSYRKYTDRFCIRFTYYNQIYRKPKSLKTLWLLLLSLYNDCEKHLDYHTLLYRINH